MQEIGKLLHVHKTRTTPYHPQSDGLVERFNRTLISMLATTVHELSVVSQESVAWLIIHLFTPHIVCVPFEDQSCYLYNRSIYRPILCAWVMCKGPIQWEYTKDQSNGDRMHVTKNLMHVQRTSRMGQCMYCSYAWHGLVRAYVKYEGPVIWELNVHKE